MNAFLRAFANQSTPPCCRRREAATHARFPEKHAFVLRLPQCFLFVASSALPPPPLSDVVLCVI